MSKNLLNEINENDVENLTTLIQKLEESSFNFLKIENQDFKIVIGKNGITESVEASNGNGQVATLTPAKPEPVQAPQHKEAAVTLEPPTQEVAPSKASPAKLLCLSKREPLQSRQQQLVYFMLNLSQAQLLT